MYHLSGIEPGEYQDELSQCRECKGLFYCMIDGYCIGCYQSLESELLADQLEDW